MPAREAPVAQAAPAPREALQVESFRKATVFDPEFQDILRRDPIAQAIRGAWRNRQQHGRHAYNQMMEHVAASGPFDFLLHILKSVPVGFVAPQADPTPTQKDMAAFLNEQFQRLDWSKIVDGWVGQAYQYGFSLAEITTRVEPWNGRPFVQIAEFTPLPQASLDSDYASETVLANAPSTFVPTYTCFDYDARGKVVGFHQFRVTNESPGRVSWVGPDALHVLYLKRGGGDGNPFGQSLLFTAFNHWADLYLLEKQEQLLLENAPVYLTGSYDGDEPNPNLHERIVRVVSETDPSNALLVGNNIKWGKVSRSDPDYVNHITAKKRELRSYITEGLLIPRSVYGETGERDLDTRNLTQVFLKFILPALLDEIGEVMTLQFGKRLVDANYSNVESKDYPVFRWRFITPNDMRLAVSMITLALPHVHTDKLAEMFEDFCPGFEAEYIAKDPKDSVGIARQAAIAAAGAVASNEGKPNASPPQKEEGSERERLDGQTENARSQVETEA